MHALFSLALCLLTQLPAGLEASGPTIQRGGFVYVPLVRGGVAVVDASGSEPRVISTVLDGHFISRLVADGEQLLALESREDAIVLTLEDPQRPRVVRGLVVPVAASGEKPAVVVEPPRAPSPVGVVREVTGGRVIFDGGTTKGFTKGQHVRVLSQRKVRKPDLVSGGTVEVPSGEVTAVLAIEQAEADASMAVLGRGDVAEKGDLVEVTQEPLSERLLFSRRAPFEWRFGFAVRPFLGLEGTTKPVGVLTDAFVSWYPSSVPLSVSVMASPFGVVINGQEKHYPGTFIAMAGYSTDYFEIGLGAGGLIGNVGPCGPNETGTGTTCEVNNGFTINQSLRLGSLDGFHLAWSSSIFSRPTKFVFGVGRGEISIPLTSRLGLFAGGGGGENGWATGELGIKTSLGGAGAPGTVILRASLGYSAIFDGPSREFVGGPAVAYGMEWRL